MARDTVVLERLRKICRALPDASETTSFGHPTFQVAKKTFVVLETYKGELCIVFQAELPVQQALVQSARFFTAPYIGKRGWVGLRAGGALDWDEVRDLVTESHRLVAATRVAPPRRRAASKKKLAPHRTKRARKSTRRAP